MANTDTATPPTAALQASGISPTFTVNDLRKSIQFYTEGLGFEIERQSERDGQLSYVSLRAGGARLGLGQDDFAKGRDRKKGVGLRLWIGTRQDLHALAERARRAGITLDSDPQPLPWGPLAFAVTDPDGFLITIVNEG
jgi:uncharacterized glyoxalase superfamily protein PhnB